VATFADFVLLGLVPGPADGVPIYRARRVLPGGAGPWFDLALYEQDMDAAGRAMAHAQSLFAVSAYCHAIAEVARWDGCFYAIAEPAEAPSMTAVLDWRRQQRRSWSEDEQAAWMVSLFELAAAVRTASVTLSADAIVVHHSGLRLRSLSMVTSARSEHAQLAQLWQLLGGPLPAHRQAFAALLKGLPISEVKQRLGDTGSLAKIARSIPSDVDAVRALKTAHVDEGEVQSLSSQLGDIYPGIDLLYPMAHEPAPMWSDGSTQQTVLMELPKARPVVGARTLPTLMVADVTRAASLTGLHELRSVDTGDRGDDVFATRLRGKTRELPTWFGDGIDAEAVDPDAFSPLMTARLAAPFIEEDNVFAEDGPVMLATREYQLVDDLEGPTTIDQKRPSDGVLTIDAPPGAVVVMDGHTLGTGPQRVEQLRTDQRYVVRVEAPGCLPWYHVATFPVGERLVHVDIRLQPRR
jgi:hypothetical protein